MYVSEFNRTLEVSIQSRNSCDVIIPENSLAKIFANMLDVETFSAKDIDYIKRLHYEIVVVNQPKPTAL